MYTKNWKLGGWKEQIDGERGERTSMVKSDA